MADKATLERWLAEAEERLHQFDLGSTEVEMSQGGKTVVFQRTKRSNLINRINQLRSQLGLPKMRTHFSRPINFR